MVGPTIMRLAGRVPVIKFRKGGLASGHAAPSSQPAAAAAAPAQQAAPISTSGPLSDVNLPARYRRLPLSQEEIDHINGGGIV
ncbi:hypothetical protein EVAR_55693_1 [Eumeta japonica]|uniref:28S ribosomal protein S36, mitochondrial n=1 Tax=Eumeta variegata TaxID=151549 RepID=A0A4C1Z9E4_EUMVA|nr:hypothetical protein EVAR_55693_1 [Eumeta japonica]